MSSAPPSSNPHQFRNGFNPNADPDRQHSSPLSINTHLFNITQLHSTADRAFTPTSKDGSYFPNTTSHLEIRFNLALKAGPSTSVNTTSTEGTTHPFDVVGNTAIPLSSRSPEDLPCDTTDFEDSSPVPTWDEVDPKIRRLTLDCLETHVEDFEVTRNSVNESILVNEVALFPGRRVEEMDTVSVTKAERRTMGRKIFNPFTSWRPWVGRNLPAPATANPRVLVLHPEPVFVPASPPPNEGGSDASWSDVDWWLPDEDDLYYSSGEEDIEVEYQLPKRFSLDYPAYIDFKPPQPDTNAVVVPSSSTAPPSQIQTITKSQSNIRLSLLILYRWFGNPIRDLARILNITFATGATAKDCCRIIRGAKRNRLEEYVGVYEVARFQNYPCHLKVVRHLHRSAEVLGIQLVPRPADVELAIAPPGSGPASKPQVLGSGSNLGEEGLPIEL
ncbi:hypothetical protein FGG08_006976 [Glutinoglossum americanum]|uniref:Uncharacterized protein n=1 Tax=Glutinoglossum americanum TaxID=1670608 RepID=A0A9P8L1E3_9PEZI|nr:hypothetical protein FGG08_006976 [Glutinoglossum americanum]